MGRGNSYPRIAYLTGVALVAGRVYLPFPPWHPNPGSRQPKQVLGQESSGLYTYPLPRYTPGQVYISRYASQLNSRRYS